MKKDKVLVWDAVKGEKVETIYRTAAAICVNDDSKYYRYKNKIYKSYLTTIDNQQYLTIFIQDWV